MFCKKVIYWFMTASLLAVTANALADDYSLEEIQNIVSEIEQAHATDSNGDLEVLSKYLTPKQQQDMKELAQTLAANQPSISPNWDQVKGCGTFNLDEIQNRYTTTGEGVKNIQRYQKPEVYVFVSTSLPNQAIKNLHDEADRINAHLVMRGFVKNDPNKTLGKRNEIFGDKQPGRFDIDPESFDTFGINAVPAFVVTGEQEKCVGEDCPGPIFDVIYGDMSLDAALTKIGSFGSVEVKPGAKRYLKQLRGNR